MGPLGQAEERVVGRSTLWPWKFRCGEEDNAQTQRFLSYRVIETGLDYYEHYLLFEFIVEKQV